MVSVASATALASSLRHSQLRNRLRRHHAAVLHRETPRLALAPTQGPCPARPAPPGSGERDPPVGRGGQGSTERLTDRPSDRLPSLSCMIAVGRAVNQSESQSEAAPIFVEKNTSTNKQTTNRGVTCSRCCRLESFDISTLHTHVVAHRRKCTAHDTCARTNQTYALTCFICAQTAVHTVGKV